MKRKTFTLIKIIFSIIIISYIFIYQVSLKELIKTVSQSNILILLFAFSLHAFGIYISAVRWNIIIKSQDDIEKTPGVINLMKYYLVASYFNLFLPTRFGGDLSRIIDTKENAKSYTKSTIIVFTERLNGLGVLFLFSLISSVYYIIKGNTGYIFNAGLIIGGLGLLGTIFVFSPFLEVFLKLFGFLPKNLNNKLKDISFAIKSTRKKLIEITLLSFILQLNVIIHYYLIGLALNIDINFIKYFAFIPIVLIILIIPISINGIGLRDVTLIEIFKEFSVPATFAVAFSTIDLIFMIILGIIGGLIFVFRKK
jgi:uncharacterized protein (TIRG00374 family)